jgi:hypothetical protein
MRELRALRHDPMHALAASVTGAKERAARTTSSIVRGLQIKEPLKKDGLENILVFNLPSLGYKKIKFSFVRKYFRKLRRKINLINVVFKTNKSN